jgi:hypothetical protein
MMRQFDFRHPVVWMKTHFCCAKPSQESVKTAPLTWLSRHWLLYLVALVRAGARFERGRLVERHQQEAA